MKKQEMLICLWFDNQAEEAVKFYTSVFGNSEIVRVTRYGKEGFEYHQKPEGSVATIEFRLNDMKFLALNGGPVFRFNEAISVIVNCENQQEIDYYWSMLTEGGEEVQCGWLKDKFGLSWQITPEFLNEYMTDNDESRKARVERALFSMKKLVIEDLKNAYEGIEVGAR